MLNIFGGGEVDFSKAQFTSPVVHIKMLCLFGGVSIFVHEEQKVISKALCVFGGFDTRGGSAAVPGAPPSIIAGSVLCGGASVRVRRSMRERWLQFAEHVKAAFGPIHNRY